jgi:hypothetical protein
VALTYRVDEPRRLVVIAGEYAGPAEWLKLAGNMLRDPAVTPGSAFVRDLRGAKQMPNAAAILSVFAVVVRFWPTLKPTRGAIVVDDEAVAAQLRDAVAEQARLPIEVFVAYDEALLWLEIEGREGTR